jgi:CxxC motif-containing protein (DUF1111 family)
MKPASWLWYLLAAVVVLAPAGLRALTWQRPRSQPVDTAMAQAGEVLFLHEWKPHDPLAGGDGLGPVFNAVSCVACHFQNRPGGSGSLMENVTTFTVRPANPADPPREGVVHAHGLLTDNGFSFQETLHQVDPTLPNSPRLPLDQLIRVSNTGHCERALATPRNVHVSQRNTPALFGAKLIDEIPERDIIANERLQCVKWGWAGADSEDKPVGRALRLPNGKIGRFGWKAQAASLSDFVQAACANELGLGNPGQAQPRPLSKPDYVPANLDLTAEQCDQLTAFCASLPRPTEQLPADPVAAEQSHAGKQLFRTIGCADCHTPDLGKVEGLYSDLLLHRMGQDLEGGGSYNEPPLPIPDGPPDANSSPGEWRTPPLWGVADSAPYLHDGRAPTLEDAIRLHGGQGARSSKRFAALNDHEKGQLMAFLKTLRAP